MNETSAPDIDRIRDLETENARLRALLAQAGLDAIDVAERQRKRDLEQADHLAKSRQRTSEARADTRIARADLAASERHLSDLQLTQEALLVSEERLVLAFEASGSIGWWDWDIPSDRLYASSQFAEMYGVDPEKAARGAPLQDFVEGIHPDDRDWVGAKIMHAVETAGEFAEEYRLLRPNGETLWIYARGRCYHDADGRPLRYPGVSLDITTRKTTELALVESQARLATMMEAVPVGILVAEAPTGRIVSGNRRLAKILGHDTHRAQSSAEYRAFVAYHADGTLVRPQDYPLALICSGAEERAELEVQYQRPDGSRLWIEIVGEAIRNAKGETIGGIVAVSDISSRKAADERQGILNKELAHRLKNTLAVVQSIATQTLRTAPDLQVAKDSLTKRIQTLSKAHDILLSGQGRSGSLESIVRGTVALHDPDGRVALRGLDLQVGPKAGMTLALIAHELATNAVKYGALSVPEGKVHVAWVVDTDPETKRPTVSLRWRELDGPRVVPPTRKGFGSRLIEMGLSGSVGGSVELDYAAEGLSCTIVAPLTELQFDED